MNFKSLILLILLPIIACQNKENSKGIYFNLDKDIYFEGKAIDDQYFLSFNDTIVNRCSDYRLNSDTFLINDTTFTRGEFKIFPNSKLNANVWINVKKLKLLSLEESLRLLNIDSTTVVNDGEYCYIGYNCDEFLTAIKISIKSNKVNGFYIGNNEFLEHTFFEGSIKGGIMTLTEHNPYMDADGYDTTENNIWYINSGNLIKGNTIYCVDDCDKEYILGDNRTKVPVIPNNEPLTRKEFEKQVQLERRKKQSDEKRRQKEICDWIVGNRFENNENGLVTTLEFFPIQANYTCGGAMLMTQLYNKYSFSYRVNGKKISTNFTKSSNSSQIGNIDLNINFDKKQLKYYYKNQAFIYKAVD